jgi:hypothetical protein
MTQPNMTHPIETPLSLQDQRAVLTDHLRTWQREQYGLLASIRVHERLGSDAAIQSDLMKRASQCEIAVSVLQELLAALPPDQTKG